MLPYSREVLLALFAEFNERQIWTQLAALLLLAWLLRRLLPPTTGSRRFACLALAVFWCGSSLLWYLGPYAKISFFAVPLGAIAFAQGLFFGAAAFMGSETGGASKPAHRTGFLIFATGAVLWPLPDLLAGPGWPMVRLPPLGPEPLLLLTGGVLLALDGMSRRLRLALLAAPLLFSGLSLYTAFVLRLPFDALPLPALLVSAGLLAGGGRAPTQDTDPPAAP